MPLADQVAFDTIDRLIAAARGRFAEAEWLRDGGYLMAAVYLYGYSAEMVLGASLVRIRFGKAPDDEISREEREAIRKPAKGRSRMIDDLSHPIDGLASLLIAERNDRRAQGGHKPSRAEAELEQILSEHARSIGANWRPRLRYQALTPTDDEIEAVREAAAWLLAHLDEL